MAMILLAAALLGPAQLTPLIFAFGPDPAWASLLNFAILVYMAVYSRRKIVTLSRGLTVALEAHARAMKDHAAAVEGKVRIARGSERRAENAAAEITRLAARIEELLDGRAGGQPQRTSTEGVPDEL